LFVEFADVGGGNGGVATGFGLGFLVSASIGGVDKSGCVIIVIFSKMLGFIKGCPLDDFGIVDIIDNLGSIDTITNGQGNIVERMAYTAFGQRRQGDWRARDPLLPIIPALTNRGFTGHEHIDEMGFIHMDGRVYDPSIGRFLSADSNIQAPYSTQSYNRYSYVINNPLKYTDPDGYFFVSLIAAVITKAIVASSMHILIQVAIAYTISYAATYIATGNAKAAQGAGLAAGLFMGIGGLRGGEMGANGKMQYNPGWEAGSLKTLAAHGLAGGIVQDRMGGSFSAGFLAGSAGSYLGSSGNAANTITDAVVGGTVSVIGGGKFANGAQTGAFRYLFNESMHSLKQGVPISDNERILSQNGFREEFWENRDVRGDPFAPTALEVVNDSSVKGWFANALSAFNNKELGLNLMVDYVNWIDRDYADTNPNNWSGVLSNDQITNWHDYSFNRTPWATGYIGNLGPKSWVCSPSCDSYSPEQ
jgi:RHS repeat-associated protein